MATETRFFSRHLFQGATKKNIKEKLVKLGATNIRYSGKLQGFFADKKEGKPQ